ncbi:hypothetical protein [Mycolicibacterium conceptionense]|uniref:hypothetical protein n=1 Tax=Mycolicibacterium conceptionense TaxID=451644 RepID=UPI00069DB96B|nr:hypothetical protein [Mycolicibacterium conceptionense]
MSQQFFDFDPTDRQLYDVPGAVEAYPGGDTAVRHLQPAEEGCVPVYWNAGGTLDFLALAQWVAFHEARSAQDPVLVMPYLPSARGDHDITRDAQGAARLTAATGIRRVITVDPHSSAWADAATDWGTKVYALSPTGLITRSFLAADHWEWRGVIAPDKGAVDRAGAVTEILRLPLLTAGKVRDSATGKLSGFTAPEGVGSGRYLVVDDICDGGGTFAGLAQEIHQVAPNAEMHLFVTHGLFTGRWRENLLPNFRWITAANTTGDDHDETMPEEVRQVPLLPHVIEVLARLYPASANAA